MMRQGARAGATTKQQRHGQYITVAEAERQFIDFCMEVNGAAPRSLIHGELQRYPEPDRRRNLNLWCVFYPDGIPAGAAGNWRTGDRSTWCAAGGELDHVDRDRRMAEAEARAARRQQEQAEAQANAAENARTLLASAHRAQVDHPYLQRKRIPAVGLYQLGTTLLAPMRTIEGEVVNLQKIHPDGGKRFMTGGRINGAFWQLGEIGTEVYIAEGVATAATVAEAVRRPTLAAMTAGNLVHVARAVRAHYPNTTIVIAGDCDHRTPGNPGVTKANEAASLVDGMVTWPRVCMESDCSCTDFNDLAQCRRAPA